MCFIGVRDSVSYHVTKISVLNVKYSWNVQLFTSDLTPFYWILSVRCGFKILQRYCVFICILWEPIVPWVLHQRSQTFQQLPSFTSSLIVWSQNVSSSYLSWCFLYTKSHIWKCNQWRQQRTFSNLLVHRVAFTLIWALRVGLEGCGSLELE